MTPMIMLGIGAAALGVLAIAGSSKASTKKKPGGMPVIDPNGGGFPPPTGNCMPGFYRLPSGECVPTGSPSPIPVGPVVPPSPLPGPAPVPVPNPLPGPGPIVGPVPSPTGALYYTTPLNADGSYTVRAGDFGVVIAKRLNPLDTTGATWKLLRPLNPLVMARKDPSNSGFPVFPGDVLQIPPEWKQNFAKVR